MSDGESALQSGLFGGSTRSGPLGLEASAFPAMLPRSVSTRSSEATPSSEGEAAPGPDAEFPGAPPHSSSAAAPATGGGYKKLAGHFTIERHIVGLSVAEIEKKVGYKEGLLTPGARIYVFEGTPKVGEFVFAGSTRYPSAEGLVSVEERLKAASEKIPGAWANERLIKIVPVRTPPNERDSYPKAGSPIEQWVLLVELPARLVSELKGDQRYYPR